MPILLFVKENGRGKKLTRITICGIMVTVQLQKII
jgi:hypothetical protein